ncbi:hypothetical protein [Streptacidiphilus cavernicola]|uniref:DUF222 domain-containing protein n=1 Tax=Streptacidiphilus cavernicola TaxID=3342716 RepID=A0ABV6VNV9_9ACTN
MTTHTPPPAAVAADAHWAAKMERLRNRKLPERPIRICDDEQAKAGVADAALLLAKARTAAIGELSEQGVPEDQHADWIDAHPKVVAASAQLARAESLLDEATITLTLRALPRPVWEELLTEHGPSEEQADKGMEYNPESFPAALISATSVDGMSQTEAQELLDTWADAEAKSLFTAALLLNQRTRIDLGKG